MHSLTKKTKKPTQEQLLKLWRDSHRTGSGVKKIGKRIVRTNPFPSLFKSYFVICDGKQFGPYKTKAKAESVARNVARVLDKPAKVMGQVKGKSRTSTNPVRRRKCNPTRPRKRKRNSPKVQFVLEWGSNNNFFDTLAQAKKYKAGLYSRGLLFGRHVRIVRMAQGERAKVVFEKSYS